MNALTRQLHHISALVTLRDNAPRAQYAAHDEAVFAARERAVDILEQAERVPVYAVGDRG